MEKRRRGTAVRRRGTTLERGPPLAGACQILIVLGGLGSGVGSSPSTGTIPGMSRLEPLDPGNLRETAVVGEHLLDPMLPHHAQVNGVPGRQVRMILQKPAGIRHGPVGDGKDRNAQMGHGVEEPEGNLRELQGPIAVQDLLQHLGVGTCRGSPAFDDPFEEALTGQSLGALPPGRVHEDVRVDQDHR